MKWRLVLTLIVLAGASATLNFDTKLCLALEGIPRTPLFDFYRDLTDLGKAYLYLLGSLAAWIALVFVARASAKDRMRNLANEWAKFAGFCFLTFVTTGLLVDVLKALIGRARPSSNLACSAMELSPLSFDHLFQSFPSGHAQTVFTFALLVSARKPEWRLGAILFAILIAGTRLARNVHFFSDVLGGIAVALVGLWLTQRLYDEYLAKSEDFNFSS